MWINDVWYDSESIEYVDFYISVRVLIISPALFSSKNINFLLSTERYRMARVRHAYVEEIARILNEKKKINYDKIMLCDEMKKTAHSYITYNADKI